MRRILSLAIASLLVCAPAFICPATPEAASHGDASEPELIFSETELLLGRDWVCEPAFVYGAIAAAKKIIVADRQPALEGDMPVVNAAISDLSDQRWREFVSLMLAGILEVCK